MRRRDLLTQQFVLVIVTAFGTLLAVGMLLPTLPRFAHDELGAGSFVVGIVAGAASVVAVLVQPLAGRFGDARGRRPLLVGGPALVAAAAVGYDVADSVGLLVPFRLVSGVGEAFFFVGGAIVVNDLAPDARRGEALSYFTLGLYLGLAAGPPLGDALREAAGYDTVWLAAAAAAVLATIAGAAVGETRPETVRAPRQPLVHRAALLPGLVLVAAMLGFGGFNAFAALYAVELGLSGGGAVFATFAIVVVAVRLVGARIPDRVGAERTAALALVGLAAALAMMGLWATTLGLFAGTVVFAAGQSLAFPALMTIAVRRAPVAVRGAVVGTLAAFVDLALGAGAIALGAVAAVTGYRGVFLVAGATAASALVALARLRPERDAPVSPAEAAGTPH